MKRMDWLDALKGFGIFCVTFGHLNGHPLIERYIYSFHMPLFFFLSGYLYQKPQDGGKKFVLKKTKSLFIPFLAWNIISSLAGYLMREDLVSTLRLFFMLDGKLCWNTPIWFLLLLYMVEIVYYLIERYVPYGTYVSIPVSLILWLLVYEYSAPLKLNILPACLFFYVLGIVFRSLQQNYNDKICAKFWQKAFAGFLLLCINLVFGVCLNIRISMSAGKFGNPFYFLAAALAGILFYILLFRNVSLLRTNKVLSYLGRNSLIIMAAQYWFFALYDIVFCHYMESIWLYQNTIKALVLSVVTIVLICLIVELLKAISKKSNALTSVCRWFGLKTT